MPPTLDDLVPRYLPYVARDVMTREALLRYISDPDVPESTRSVKTEWTTAAWSRIRVSRDPGARPAMMLFI